MQVATRPTLPLDRLAPFAAGGQVYHAFGRAIAAGSGTLLLVPADLLPSSRGLLSGCPVPWEEVVQTRDLAPAQRMAFSEQWHCYGPMVRRVESLGLQGWDLVPMAIPHWRAAAALFLHPSGVRYAITSDLLWGGA